MTSYSSWVHLLIEKGWIPDAILRLGIRNLLSARLVEISATNCEVRSEMEQTFVRSMKQAPIALVPEKANEQHYELPAEFFQTVLGSRLKYSCGYWDEQVSSLDESEIRALELTCEHAQLKDSMDILELGCGWGSLTLWMAERYPKSHITAVSNSLTQGAWISQRARERGVDNLKVITADMNDFSAPDTYDRVVSVEMFEHMRNYPVLYSRISQWLKPGGKFFKHIFVHRSCPYPFVDKDASDWMSRLFFSGGMMPSDDLPLFFQDHLKFEYRWRWSGRHYEKTCRAWLDKMDTNQQALRPLFIQTYGEKFAPVWWYRWRIFFMACAELFGYEKGQQWWISHYLFAKR